MRIYNALLASSICLACIHGCSSSPNVKAPALISQSFSLIQPEILHIDSQEKTLVGIHQDSLDKEFLLQASLIDQIPIPQFNGLKSRIVSFVKKEKNIYMLETLQGHSISDALPQELVIASFPIIKEHKKHYFFDFNQGMDKLFMASDWYSQDYSGSNYNSDIWKTIPLRSQYLKSVRLDDHNQLVLEQVAQLSFRRGAHDNLLPIKISYYLEPYNPDPSFVPTISPPKKQVGFFEVHPQLQNGKSNSVVYASKFHPEKNIFFSISSTVPKEYRAAVREGILYWNKSFSSEKIKIIPLPQNISAPDLRYNIVQWIPWDDAGYAYADAQMDPRTGEILHAQIFLTSAFSVSGRARAERLLQRMLKENSIENAFHTDTENSVSSSEKSSKKTFIENLKKAKLCHFDPKKVFLEGLSQIVANSELDDQSILRISQDYIREVVAHEVGHTLGLRHNFAGSQGTSFKIEEKKEIMDDYLFHQKIDQHITPTSSVMEYQKFEESILTGAIVQDKEREALTYDKLAISVLYKNEKLAAPDKTPAFCTDSQKRVFLDCKTFLSGGSLFKEALSKREKTREIIPTLLLQSYLMTKKDASLAELAEATPSAQMFTYYLMNEWRLIMKTMSNGVKLLSVHHQFPYVNELNQTDVWLKTQEVLRRQLNEVGGLKKILNGITREDLSHIFHSFYTLLEEVDPKIREFNPKEKKFILEQVSKVLNRSFILGKNLNLLYLNRLSSVANYLSTDLEKWLKNEMSVIILQSSTKKTYKIIHEENELTIHLPKFSYPTSMRMMASTLMDKKANRPAWGLAAKEQVQDEFHKLISESLGLPIHSMSLKDLPPDVADWIIVNKTLLYSLSS